THAKTRSTKLLSQGSIQWYTEKEMVDFVPRGGGGASNEMDVDDDAERRPPEELFFLIADFLERATPCRDAVQALRRDMERNHLFGQAFNWRGEPRPATLAQMRLRYGGVPPSQLPQLLSAYARAPGAPRMLTGPVAPVAVEAEAAREAAAELASASPADTAA
ncbi:unnamed protein product, partial [Phaeothamnion confervicola]